LSKHNDSALNRFQENNRKNNASTVLVTPHKALRGQNPPMVVTPDATGIPTMATTPYAYVSMRDLMLDENGCGGSTKRLLFTEDIFDCKPGDDILLIIPGKSPVLYDKYRQYLNKYDLAYKSFEFQLPSSQTLTEKKCLMHLGNVCTMTQAA
jgi:hypothetical protein